MMFSVVAINYNNSYFGLQYPGSRFQISHRCCAHWWMGNNYSNVTSFYGAYPPMYLRRIESMFPYNKYKTLHLFSGSLPPGNYVRIDINPHVTPDFVCSSEKIPFKNKFDVILADPPYLEKDAEKYGYSMPNKKRTLESCYTALKQNGFLVWLDQALPIYKKEMFDVKGFISVIRSTNHRFRIATVFQKR